MCVYARQNLKYVVYSHDFLFIDYIANQQLLSLYIDLFME